MAKPKLKQHSEILHSTEHELDKPKLGDVRIEEGIARDAKTGEVLSALWKHPKTGHLMSPGLHLNEDGSVTRTPVPPDYVPHRDEKRAHKVYVYEKRPEKGEHGLYWHSDQEETVPFNPHAFRTDKQGFYVDTAGNRVQRFAEPEFWAPKGEHEDFEAAHKIAQKHLGE